jgi:hypothetical protein
MDVIRFNTVVGDDQIIRLPSGIAVPPGPCQVTVERAHADIAAAKLIQPDIWDWLLDQAAEAERDPADLPSDLAENHDFYAHGKPRQ